VVNRPVINGIGNGYCQDILFRAGLHPRRRVVDLSADERKRLFPAIRDTLTQAISRGGRDTERDTFGQPGGYVPILDKRAKGQPCPACGKTIEVICYLGGSCYFCPTCQPSG
jgi:formamidopyrimidine-DNA glycosylase